MESPRKNKKQFKCQKCTLTFYHRRGLNIHRRIHESDKSTMTAVVDVEGGCKKYQRGERSSPRDNHTHHTTNADQPAPLIKVEPMLKLDEQLSLECPVRDMSPSLIEDDRVDSILVDLMKRTRGDTSNGRRSFISDKMFNRMTWKNPFLTKWEDISRDYIYKVEAIFRHDQQIIADLARRDGVILSAVLPDFVVQKLSKLRETVPVAVYLRPIENDGQVLIALVQKRVCEDCKLQFESSKSLYNHQKRKHCIVRE